ncbi:oligoendopeptidase F [bacterium]|nr:oligoendopeptidase F [bacterium]MBU1985489.1 oligoendopeptidase F [bacterium]
MIHHHHIPFVCALMLLLAVPATRTLGVERSQIDDGYKWKPEHIYENVAAWEADMKVIREGLDELAAFKGKFAGENAKTPAEDLIAFNKLSEAITTKFEQTYTYVMYNYHVNMGNTEWMGRMQELSNLGVDFGQKLAWATPELLLIPEATLLGWCGKYPKLADYRKSYQDMYALQEHVLSEKEEEILALSGNITGTASDVYGKFTNVDMTFGTILDENGDTVKVTDEGWVGWRTNQNRRVREEYFKAVWNEYEKYGTTLAALMAGNLKKNLYLSKARKFDNTLQAALSSTFVPEAVYVNLVSATRANTAPLHKYEALRKRVLKLDHYRHWDYYVSLIDADETRYTWEEAVAMISDALKPLGEEYLTDITHGLSPASGWVDVYASDGKRGGAYSSSCYGVHPYMLFNFDHQKGLTMDDASTVAHEVGHSMHTYYSEKNQPYPNKDYVIFNAEVASTTNESLFNMKMLDEARAAYKKAKGAEKDAAKKRLIYLLDQNLASARGTFFRQTQFAAWELEANKMAEAGKPLTRDSFNQLYGDLLKEFYGPAAEYEDLSAVSWSRIPHFYRGYYVYTYATSYAAAIALAKDIRAEQMGDAKKKGATQRYLNYLKSGSAKHPVELLKDAGVDMTTPAPIQSFIQYFTEMVNELDKLTS